MSSLTIHQLKEDTTESTPLLATILCQLQARHHKETRNGKPYFQLDLSDATGTFSLKAWNNHRQFEQIASLDIGHTLKLDGRWTQNKYGIDSSDWSYSDPAPEDLEAMLSGDPALHAKQAYDWDTILDLLHNIQDPRLHALGQHFIATHGTAFRRTAAARKNHHARRGGLVEHVAQMMRTAQALSTAYPTLNLDLLHVAILLHDCGKLWENTYDATSLVQNYTLEGEMLGHIPLGMQVCRDLWQELLTQNPDWQSTHAQNGPDNNTVLLHLLHLIASHHGTHEFGSPALPRTPEAFALHHIDNLDAKLEMLNDAYRESTQLADGIYERHFPLPGNPIAPLPKVSGTPPTTTVQSPTQKKSPAQNGEPPVLRAQDPPSLRSQDPPSLPQAPAQPSFQENDDFLF